MATSGRLGFPFLPRGQRSIQQTVNDRCAIGVAYLDAERDRPLAMGGKDDAALSHQVQLHPGDVGQADREPRRPAEGCPVVHRVGRREAPWVLVRLRLPRWLQPVGGPRRRVHGRGRDGHTGGGALSSFETTVLLTVDETI